jgi:hypothetical protein
MEQTQHPQEELAYIRKIMAESRGQVADDGRPSIVWGIVVALGMLFTYYEAKTQTTDINGWVWIGLSVLGCLYMFFWVQRKRRTQRAQTFGDRVSGAIWGAVGISLALVIIGTQVGYAFERDIELHPIFVLTITAVILGIGYFVSSILYEIPLLKWVAFGWWASALVYLFWPGIHSLLIYAGAMVVLQIIPGIIVLRRYKRSLA